MKKDINEILDKSLERVMRGETIEVVLSEYPEFSKELEPLLRTAVGISRLPKVQPSQEYIDTTRTSLLRQIYQSDTGKEPVTGLSDFYRRITGSAGSFWRNITAPKRLSVAIATTLVVVLVAVMGQFTFFKPSPAMASTCILTVLSGEVTVQEKDSDTYQPSIDGMILEEGAQVKTEADSHALLTFFDGSTIKLEPDTVLELQEMDGDDSDSTVIVLKQWLGKTWSRVVKMIEPGSRFEIETPSAVAIVRGTLFTTDVSDQGLTTVSTTEGLVSVQAEESEVFVAKNQKTEVNRGEKPSEPVETPDPESRIYIAISGGVVGSVSDPTGSSTGGLPDGTEFNQISNSKTSVSGSGTQVITIDEPVNGKYTFTLRYVTEEAAEYTIQTRYGGNITFNYSGSMNAGGENGYMLQFNLNNSGNSLDVGNINVKPLGNETPEKTGKRPEKGEEQSQGKGKTDDEKGNSGKDDQNGKSENGNSGNGPGLDPSNNDTTGNDKGNNGQDKKNDSSGTGNETKANDQTDKGNDNDPSSSGKDQSDNSKGNDDKDSRTGNSGKTKDKDKDDTQDTEQ